MDNQLPVKIDLRSTSTDQPETAHLPLTRLAEMQCGIVAEVDAEGDTIAQLMAMGVCRGRRVELIKRGDPMIMRVLGSRIGLSARLAEQVTVEVCAPDHCHPDPQ